MPKSSVDVLKDLKKKNFVPLYLLHGDEPFYIDKIADFIESNALPVSEQSFNQFILFGKDITVPSLLSYAKRFPMMSDRQLILVKEAQAIQGIDQKEMQKLLEDYAKRPLDSTILVLAYKDTVKEHLNWVKAFDQHGVSMPSKKLYDNKIPDWVLGYCHENGTKISPKAVQMLVENVGSDLKRLASEIDKILINLRVDEEINAGIVEKYVGISKEYNVFEFQKSLTNRDIMKANQIINFFAKNPKDNPLPQIIILLYNYFSKVLLVHATQDKSEKNVAAILGINPFFAKDYMLAVRNYSMGKVAHILHEIKIADLRSKGIEGGAADEEAILKELTFSILH